MKVRDLLIGAGVVASVCAATPPARMLTIAAGTWHPLYGAASTVGEFRIDRDPVTREEFLRWTGVKGPVSNPRAPMTEVNKREAAAYCAARGGRLPTLAEWERVAAADARAMQDLVSTYMTRSANAPVERGAANRYGVRGLHDFAWEWVGDLHAHHGSHDVGCAGAALDATDPRDYPAFLRAAFRAGLEDTTRLPTLGFRCAR